MNEGIKIDGINTIDDYRAHPEEHIPDRRVKIRSVNRDGWCIDEITMRTHQNPRYVGFGGVGKNDVIFRLCGVGLNFRKNFCTVPAYKDRFFYEDYTAKELWLDKSVSFEPILIRALNETIVDLGPDFVPREVNDKGIQRSDLVARVA